MHAGLKRRLSLYNGPSYAFQQTTEYFKNDNLISKLALSLAKREAIDMKEFSESMEFFTHVRKHWRKIVKQERISQRNTTTQIAEEKSATNNGIAPPSSVVVDLCCGHGFTGLLFAVFERDCSQVILADRGRPKSFDNILSAVLEVAPWVESKVDLTHFGVPTGDLQFLDTNSATTACTEQHVLPTGSTILAVHACGGATDMCLNIGLQLQSSCIYLLPCCYRAANLSKNNKLYVPRTCSHQHHHYQHQKVIGKMVDRGQMMTKWKERRPYELEARLGRGLSTDIDRTYVLHEEGYDVVWSVLPPEVTPMNRLIMATKEWRVTTKKEVAETKESCNMGSKRENNRHSPDSLTDVVYLFWLAWVGLFSYTFSLPFNWYSMLVAAFTALTGVLSGGEDEGDEDEGGGSGDGGQSEKSGMKKHSMQTPLSLKTNNSERGTSSSFSPAPSSRPSRLRRKLKKQRKKEKRKIEEEKVE